MDDGKVEGNMGCVAVTGRQLERFDLDKHSSSTNAAQDLI